MIAIADDVHYYYLRKLLRISIIASSTCLTVSAHHAFPTFLHAQFRNLPVRLRWKQSTNTVSSLRLVSGWVNLDVFMRHVNFDNDIDEKNAYPQPSSIERVLIRDRLVYIKHDDYLHLPRSNISGNKARKFFTLNYIPAKEFPDAIVSYGGPQSNAMVALAAIVSSKNRELEEMNSYDTKDNIFDTDRENDEPFGKLNLIQKDNQISVEEYEDFMECFTTRSAEKVGQLGDTVSRKKTLLKRKNNSESSCHKTNQPIKRFIYYTKSIPRYLRNHPNGNLLRALALGMEIRTVSQQEYSHLFGGLHGGSAMAPADLDPPIPGRSLWIPQGGACKIAERGSDILAQEIVDFWSLNGKGMPLAVCIPGGTCTTALLLHRSLKKITKGAKCKLDIRVVVIPCVGDDEYAKRQMISLNKSVGEDVSVSDTPFVLRPKVDINYGPIRQHSGGYFTFGEPDNVLLATFDEMNEAGLNIDLIYGAPAWNLLLQNWKSSDSTCPIHGRQVMYVHSGGLEGVASQLTRYKHKGLLE